MNGTILKMHTKKAEIVIKAISQVVKQYPKETENGILKNYFKNKNYKNADGCGYIHKSSEYFRNDKRGGLNDNN